MASPLAQAVAGYSQQESLTPRTLDYLRSLERLMAPDCVKIDTSHHYGEQAKYVTVRIPDKWPTIELIQLTDIQFGHVACKIKRVIEYRDWILDKPNRFILMTGDNVDAATIFSPGTPWDNLFGPQSQAYRFAEVFAPARHRILGYVGGNHERRAMPAFGDIGTLVATLLRVPYSAGQQFIDIYFGQHKPFKIHLWHGTGGARTKGAVAQVLDRYMHKSDSQLFLMGHLHQGMIIPGWRTVRDGRGKIILQKKFGAIGTSFLETWGTYGEISGFDGHDVLMPRAVLEPNGRWEITLK